ncbi:MAG: sugar ABC transporter substrate-binding protein [Clostridia bacterium]|nr:sugar ABC transporter substrate-binding protein [Clostridia bacterium]
MRKLSKLLVVILILSLVVVAVGCGAGDKAEDKTDDPDTEDTQDAGKDISDEDSGEAVEIVWWQYPRYTNVGEKEVGDFENEIIADFEEENPNIKVKIEMIPWNGGPEKVNVAIASNNTPDILFDYPGRIIGYGIQGALVPLDDIMEDVKSEIPENLLRDCQYDGKTYMYPNGAAAIGIAVNLDFFKEIGKEDLLPLDKEDRTWTLEEFEAVLKAVKDSGKDVYPSVIYAGNEQGDSSMRMFIQSAFDAELISDDHTEITFNDENAVKGLEWMINAYKDGLFAPGAESAVSMDSIETFFQGKSAINIIASAQHHGLHETYIADGKAEEFEWVLFPPPSAEGKDPKAEVQLSGYCVFDNKDEAKAEAAKKLVKFILDSDKYREESVKATGQIPVRNTITGLYENEDYIFSEKLLKYAADTAYTANNYAGLRTKWYPNIQGALTDKMTAQEALDAFAKEGTEEINKK